jgi:DnaJ homolog subfamily C member 19
MKWLWLVAAVTAWFAWRHWSRARAGVSAEMDARAVLGVGAGADAEAIRTAHRQRIAESHPDRGGSAEVTRRINAARDLLLKERR